MPLLLILGMLNEANMKCQLHDVIPNLERVKNPTGYSKKTIKKMKQNTETQREINHG